VEASDASDLKPISIAVSTFATPYSNLFHPRNHHNSKSCTWKDALTAQLAKDRKNRIVKNDNDGDIFIAIFHHNDKNVAIVTNCEK
jgi:hypothetical protein